jgi:hypothetical protein
MGIWKMNERIKELANQVDACYIPRYDMWQMDTETMEKFAELIVKECTEVCRRGKYEGRDDMSLIQFNNGIRFCMNAIDEHFGD